MVYKNELLHRPIFFIRTTNRAFVSSAGKYFLVRGKWEETHTFLLQPQALSRRAPHVFCVSSCLVSSCQETLSATIASDCVCVCVSISLASGSSVCPVLFPLQHGHIVRVFSTLQKRGLVLGFLKLSLFSNFANNFAYGISLIVSKF